MTTLGAPAGLPISGSGCQCGGACELRLSYPACRAGICKAAAQRTGIGIRSRSGSISGGVSSLAFHLASLEPRSVVGLPRQAHGPRPAPASVRWALPSLGGSFHARADHLGFAFSAHRQATLGETTGAQRPCVELIPKRDTVRYLLSSFQKIQTTEKV